METAACLELFLRIYTGEYDAVAVCISEDFRIFVLVFALSYATARPCYTHTYPS